MFKMPNVDQEASPRFTSPRILEWSEWPDSSTQRIFRHLVETACEMTDGGARCDLDMSDWHTLSIDVTGYRNQAPPMRATRSRRARDATSEETGIDLVPANLPVVLYWKREDEPAQETSEYRAVHRIALEGWHNLDTYQLYMHPGTYELRFEIPGIAPQVSDEIQMYVWKTSAMIDTHAKAQVVIDFHNLKCDRLPRPGRGSIQQRW